MSSKMVSLAEVLPEFDSPEEREILSKHELCITYSPTYNALSLGNCGVFGLSYLAAEAKYNWPKTLKPAELIKASKNFQGTLVHEWGHLNNEFYLGKKYIRIYDKIQPFLKDFGNLNPFEELKDKILKEQTSNLFFLSDSINKHSLLRGTPTQRDPHQVSTTSFAQYLIKNKIGYVVQSPVAVNNVHTVKSDFSLVQAFFWVPPNRKAYKPHKLNGVGSIMSEEDLVSSLHNSTLSSVSKEKVKDYVNSWRINNT